jgi:Thioesterase-like superfamily
MSEQSVFIARDGRFVATEYARGPWDPNAQHGGAPAALLMRAFERLPATDGLALARVTYEFLRPAALGEFEVNADVVRPGKRVQLLEASMRTPDGTEVVRARALQVQAADPSARRTPHAAPPTGPEQGGDNDFDAAYRPMFTPDTIEVRFITGSFTRTGPSTAWFRLRRPLVGAEEATPLQRLAAAGDFGNGISAALPWDEYVFINPDLTLYIEREPVGDWIGLEAQTIIAPGGIGTAESVLYDERGRVGRANQALLIAPR